ncbi:MAG TPA: Verru_Chthon cassette protein C [Candidatus Methylacidiphilales bacterium]
MGLRRKKSGDNSLSEGFTLVEMLVATVILVLIMALVFTMTDQTSKIWKSSTAQIQSFQAARAAYDTLTMRLRQATLNTYLDYYDNETPPETYAAFLAANPSGTFIPAAYARNSDLHFVVDQAAHIFTGTQTLHPGHAVFFQAPLGFTANPASYGPLQNMLNACGYYVEFNTDKPSFPPFLSSSAVVHERYRYRLMEFLQPAEANTIYSIPYNLNTPISQYEQWFTNFLPTSAGQVNNPASGAPYHVLAENIIALILSPELTPTDQSIAPNYTYDSRAGGITTTTSWHHQLPPLLRVVMVAIDEPSAIRLNPNGNSTVPAVISNFFAGGSNPLFQSAGNLDSDLSTLTQALNASKVSYRVFDTNIAIRGAKWSTQ